MLPNSNTPLPSVGANGQITFPHLKDKYLQRITTDKEFREEDKENHIKNL